MLGGSYTPKHRTPRPPCSESLPTTCSTPHYALGLLMTKDGWRFAACPSAHFLCEDRSECVHVDRYQDGIEDCADGSDEGMSFHSKDPSFECRSL